MTQNASQQRFLEDVKKLDLRFPVAEIAKRTKASKGNISRYVKGELKPSGPFLEKFYESFKDDLETVKDIPQATAPKLDTKALADEVNKLQDKANAENKRPSAIDSLAFSTAQLSESNLINAKNIDRLISLLERQQANSDDSSDTYSAKEISAWVRALGQKLKGQKVDSPGKFAAYALKILAEIRARGGEDIPIEAQPASQPVGQE